MWWSGKVRYKDMKSQSTMFVNVVSKETSNVIINGLRIAMVCPIYAQQVLVYKTMDNSAEVSLCFFKAMTAIGVHMRQWTGSSPIHVDGLSPV